MRTLVSLLALAICLSSCASFAALEPRAPQRAVKDPAVSAFRQKLVEGATSLLGKRELVVRGRRFTWDCTGTVLAIYWYAGVDLARDFGKYRGGGVARLYRTLEADNLLYNASFPISGDLVFWDNTLDENADGQWNDLLTHVGMVMSTEGDGTVTFIHHNMRKGIILEKMNLLRPDVQKRLDWGQLKLINSPMRLAQPGIPHPPKWLAGQLYRSLGMGYFFQ
jgi:hypothetical protein